MVIDNESMKHLHDLTIQGEKSYSDYLESEADKILYKANHPLKYYLSLIWDLIKLFCYRDDSEDYDTKLS